MRVFFKFQTRLQYEVQLEESLIVIAGEKQDSV